MPATETTNCGGSRKSDELSMLQVPKRLFKKRTLPEDFQTSTWRRLWAVHFRRTVVTVRPGGCWAWMYTLIYWVCVDALASVQVLRTLCDWSHHGICKRISRGAESLVAQAGTSKPRESAQSTSTKCEGSYSPSGGIRASVGEFRTIIQPKESVTRRGLYKQGRLGPQ